jgi:nicotinamidase/pyrazinamidase
VRALILVDIQNDFLPGGALPVPAGDRVVPLANELARHFELVVATQDWHPPRHESFAATREGRKVGDVVDLYGLPQVLWPVHCVQHTRGAELAPELEQHRIARIFQKGTDPRVDSYSGFYDNGHRAATGLGGYLTALGVTDVYICGLATDYCVKATALDAVKLGFNTFVIEDACRGVDRTPGDVVFAIEEMKRAGVQLIRSGEVLKTPDLTTA